MEETTPQVSLETTQQVMDTDSAPWNSTTRRIAALILALLVLFLMWRFQGLIVQVVIAALLAYLLNPVIDFITRRTRLKRGWVTMIVYVLFMLLLFGLLALIGVALYSQVAELVDSLPGLINRAVKFVGELTNNPDAALVIGPYSLRVADIDWRDLDIQSWGLVDPALRSGPRVVGQVAQSTVNMIGWFLMTFLMSVYIALDLPRLGSELDTTMVHSGYYADYIRLRQGLLNIGNAYLRGQVILGGAVGIMTAVLLGLLGVRNALALGLLAGLFELVPYFGPWISAIIAVLVAFFQPQNYLGLGQMQFALATLAVMVLVQQLENNFLVPRIVGNALNLRPLTVIIAAIIGGALAGIVGVVLAAPVAAAIRLVGGYLWRKMLLLPAFPPEDARAMRGPSLLGRTIAHIRHRRVPKSDTGPPGEPPPAVVS